MPVDSFRFHSSRIPLYRGTRSLSACTQIAARIEDLRWSESLRSQLEEAALVLSGFSGSGPGFAQILSGLPKLSSFGEARWLSPGTLSVSLVLSLLWHCLRPGSWLLGSYVSCDLAL